jgi:hypothetical protein
VVGIPLQAVKTRNKSNLRAIESTGFELQIVFAESDDASALTSTHHDL